MKIILEIPEYSNLNGIRYKWEDDFKIKSGYINGSIIISANSAGLTSLANHLLNLAQKEVPEYSHLHFDEYNSLEEGSIEITIEKKE